MNKLNIACGGRYSEKWINIDFHADSSSVKKVNILAGLPFEDSSFEFVYCSHFLEHLSLSQVKILIGEVLRVLKPNGIFRVVVPDLENICREYLRVLADVDTEKFSEKKYEWVVVELLDQLVRVNAGGDMAKTFKKVANSKDIELAEYILHRTGDELINNKLKKKRKVTFDKIKNKIFYLYLRFIQLLIPKNLRELIFVNTSIGERHQWMYDKYSMTKLLQLEGFKEVVVEKFNTGRIENFNSYMLDIKKDGTAYKGESSLYIEAIK
ncbi:MAG: putative SAM-dependent methyltransferase [Flavobacteriaceae bacterium]|jgi:predicted SAM-dependent methyltransferase